MSKLLIVIPAYNEEESIVSVVEELTTHYPQYDYVVVNDDLQRTKREIQEIIRKEKEKQI